jgi:hypothetical protein
MQKSSTAGEQLKCRVVRELELTRSGMRDELRGALDEDERESSYALAEAESRILKEVSSNRYNITNEVRQMLANARGEEDFSKAVMCLLSEVKDVRREVAETKNVVSEKITSQRSAQVKGLDQITSSVSSILNEMAQQRQNSNNMQQHVMKDANMAIAEAEAKILKEVALSRYNITGEVRQLLANANDEEDFSQAISALLSEVKDVRRELAETKNTVSEKINSHKNTQVQSLDNITASVTEILNEIKQHRQVENVKQKLTSKGSDFEHELYSLLDKASGIGGVALLKEMNEYNKQGGDLLVWNHQNVKCILEAKWIDKLKAGDFTKFERDANSPSDVSIYIFVRKGGVGNSVTLANKPFVEKTREGKLLIWYKEDEHELVKQLPLLLGVSTLMFGCASKDGNNPLETIDTLKTAVTTALKTVKADIKHVTDDAAKRLTVLRKRQSDLEDVLSKSEGEVAPPPKKVRGTI